jgi:hypothetical protein
MGIRRADSICRTGLCEADALLIQTAPPTLPLQLGGLKRGRARGGALRTCSVFHGINPIERVDVDSSSKRQQVDEKEGDEWRALHCLQWQVWRRILASGVLVRRHCLFPDANRVVCLRLALVPVNTCIIALLHVDKWCCLFGLES